MLLAFSAHTPLKDKSKGHGIKACVLGNGGSDTPLSTSSSNKPSRTAAVNATKISVELAQWNALNAVDASKFNVSATMGAAQTRMKKTTNVLSHLCRPQERAAVGIWIGALVRDDIFRAEVIKKFFEKMNSGEKREKQIAHLCDESHGADFGFGITVAYGDLALETVQEDVKAWADSTCIKNTPQTSQFGDPALTTKPPARRSRRSAPNNKLWSRGLCRSMRVGQGEGCYDLAEKCGISLNDFQKCNPGSNFCSSLQPKQPVCCSEGTLPKPEKGSDGSCAAYTVQGGDTCGSIAAFNGIQTSDLENWNKKTWGWFTCNNLQAKARICLSDGYPPMPEPVPNAECGPTVPGTNNPAREVDLAGLNHCPLKACCNFWGHCGTTSQFCSKAGGNVPPTLACISNCGIDRYR